MDHEARIEKLADALQRLVDANLENAETHKDAGDGYAHLPREGTWQYQNKDEQLDRFMTERGIDRHGLELDEISELVLDNFKMESGNIYHGLPNYHDGDVFVVDAFPIGEVEFQVDVTMLANIDPSATRDDWREAKSKSGIAFTGDLAYTPSDGIWYALIRKEALQELIADAAHEPDSLDI